MGELRGLIAALLPSQSATLQLAVEGLGATSE